MLKRIPLDKITRNPDQPRQSFDQLALEDLAASIEENGLKQPITVRPIEPDADGHTFMVVMGERRFRAHQLLADAGKAKDILAHVRKMDEREMHIDAILENLQRVDVSPLEEAIAYQRAIDSHGFTVETLGKTLGISQLWRITDRIRLLGLTSDNRDLVAKGIISPTQAYHMAILSPNGQTKFLELVKAGLVATNQAAKEAAAEIEAKEAQSGFDMSETQPVKKASAKPLECKIDGIGIAIRPLLKDGSFSVDGKIDPAGAQRCIQKIVGLRSTLGQIERELTRAASVSAIS